MQNNVRYYIVKRDDQPVVRSVMVERPMAASPARPVAAPEREHDEPQLSVTSKLRLALRRRQQDTRA